MRKNPKGSKEPRKTKLTLKSSFKLARSTSDHFLTLFQKNGYFQSFSVVFGRFYALKRLKTHEFERKPDQLPENAENMRFMSDLRNTNNKLGLNHLKQTAHAHVRTYLCRRFSLTKYQGKTLLRNIFTFYLYLTTGTSETKLLIIR